MSSRPNNSSKTVLDYSKVLKKSSPVQEVQKSVEPVQVVQKSVEVVQEPVKSVKKLSEAKYAKKLESKAHKKAETEKEAQLKEEKITEIKAKAQKAFDDEYQIQFIECKSEEEAHKKSMSKYTKVYNKLFSKAFPKPKVEKAPAPKLVSDTDTKIEETILSDDDNDELIVPVKQIVQKSSKPTEIPSTHLQQTITPEELKDFKSVSKKRYTKSNLKSENSENTVNNSYNDMLNKACDAFIVDILSESILDKLETSLRKADTTDKVFVPVNTDSDVITSFKGHNFTKSGFLKNTNYYFSKQLSKAINNKLKDLRVWVNIKNVKDNEYSIAFSQKH